MELVDARLTIVHVETDFYATRLDGQTKAVECDELFLHEKIIYSPPSKIRFEGLVFIDSASQNYHLQPFQLGIG